MSRLESIKGNSSTFCCYVAGDVFWAEAGRRAGWPVCKDGRRPPRALLSASASLEAVEPVWCKILPAVLLCEGRVIHWGV